MATATLLNIQTNGTLVDHDATPEQQDAVRRAVEMGLTLRRQYFQNLDQWVFEGKPW